MSFIVSNGGDLQIPMPLSDNAKDILSFGAHGRVQAKLEEYETVRQEVLHWHAVLEEKIRDANALHERWLHVRHDAVSELIKIRDLVKHIRLRERTFSSSPVAESMSLALRHVETTLTDSELANAALGAASASASTLLGAIALGAAGGSVATGTAAGALVGFGLVPALAGASAAPAVAGGAALIGGIAVLPAAAAMAIFSHVKANKKVAEIERAIMELSQERAKIAGQQVLIQALQLRLEEINRATQKCSGTFALEFQRARRRLFPLGFLSRAWKRLRQILGLGYYGRGDLLVLSSVLQMAELLAGLIDLKVLETTHEEPDELKR